MISEKDEILDEILRLIDEHLEALRFGLLHDEFKQYVRRRKRMEVLLKRINPRRFQAK